MVMEELHEFHPTSQYAFQDPLAAVNGEQEGVQTGAEPTQGFTEDDPFGLSISNISAAEWLERLLPKLRAEKERHEQGLRPDRDSMWSNDNWRFIQKQFIHHNYPTQQVEDTAVKEILPAFISIHPIKGKEPLKCYRYGAIPEGAIRILTLRPGMDDEPICASLEVSMLHDSPSYMAISYVWGEPVFSETIFMPGGVVKITKSLDEALRRFRDRYKPIAVWADAVCINQNDIIERQDQVAMMGHIYQEAEKVLIWLGEAYDSDAQSFWLLHQLWRDTDFMEDYMRLALDFQLSGSPYGKTLPNILTSWYKRTRHPSSGQMICPCCGSPFQHRDLSLQEAVKGLAKLWQRKWWTRLWVIQEVICAKQAAFFCGVHRISKEDLGSAISGFMGICVSGQEGNKSITVLPDWMRIKSIQGILNDARGISYSKDRPAATKLLDLLMLTAGQQCSDLHDRVYGVASLTELTLKTKSGPISAISTLRDWPWLGLAPDYSTPLGTLWLQVATLILTCPESWDQDRADAGAPAHPALLLALCSSNDISKNSTIPCSWVPDFGNLGVDATRLYERYSGAHRSLNSVQQRPLNPPRLRNPSQLCFQGKTITSLSIVLPASQFPRRSPYSTEQFAQYVEKNLLPWYFTCREFMANHRDERNATIFGAGKYVSRFLCQGRVRDAMPTRMHHSEFESIFKRAAPPAPEPVPSLVTELDLMHHNYLHDMDAYIELDRLLDEAFHELDLLDTARVLALTSDGRFAWVPERASVGDTVCILLACPYPFLLRNHEEGTYSVIGDAYVRGLMRGQRWPTSDGEWEDICLV